MNPILRELNEKEPTLFQDGALSIIEAHLNETVNSQNFRDMRKSCNAEAWNREMALVRIKSHRRAGHDTLVLHLAALLVKMYPSCLLYTPNVVVLDHDGTLVGHKGEYPESAWRNLWGENVMPVPPKFAYEYKETEASPIIITNAFKPEEIPDWVWRRHRTLIACLG